MLEKLLNQKTLITSTLLAVFLGGIFAYLNMGKLEDAEIPIKSAIIYTFYPGANAHEVELEVTDILEKEIQRLESIEDIESISMPGMSYIKVNILPTVKTKDLPQLWDHLRRKVNDIKPNLPQRAWEPVVNDDFSDVYGMFFAVTSDGYSNKELNDYVEYIRRVLVDIKGIRRAQIYGKQIETIEILFSSEDLAALSINPMLIASTVQSHGIIVNPGTISTTGESIKIDVGSKIESLKEIEDLLIQVPGGGNFRLGDIAKIKRSVLEPRRESLSFNGQMAMSIGLSNEAGVNVVKVGEKVRAKIEELKKDLPVGIEIHDIYFQPDRVRSSVRDFMINLVLSVGIVIVVLLFAMGLRSGLLIASGLIFTIFATLLIMLGINLPLHRVTLAAIIIAMGMLVDNSIVVGDGILIDLKKGINPGKAYIFTAKKTALPLLGATIVAILAFLPLRMAPSRAGEFMNSLFTVLCVSLLFSWIFAMVQTPFMAKYFLKRNYGSKKETNPFDKGLYPYYKKSIHWVLSHKAFFLITIVIVLLVTFAGFKQVKKDFFPKIDYNHFVVEYLQGNGCDIDQIDHDLKQIAKHTKNMDEVYSVTTAIRRPPARYSLMRPMAKGGNNYGELIIETKYSDDIPKVFEKIKEYAFKEFPGGIVRKMQYGPYFNEFEIEVEFSGPDPVVLRNLSNQAKEIMYKNSNAINVCDNWRNKVKVFTPEYAIENAQKSGLSRIDMANSILVSTKGMPIGSIYEGVDNLPVVLKLEKPVEEEVKKMSTIPVWGKTSFKSVPLNQITNKIKLQWEEEQVHRYNGKRAMKAQCDVIDGVLPSELQAELKDQINAIPIPDGYSRRWDGTVGSSSEARSALFKFLPLALVVMFIIIISLFNNIKQPVIIFLIVPFAFIGIIIGFLLTDQSFTFIGIIGALGLIGMMIKNSVVLLDEINIGIKEGKPALESTIDASISRMRPVMMASVTTILGMFPLLWDIMFVSLAITIMFGLIFGSLITLYVVPTLYATFYGLNTRTLKTNSYKVS